MDLLDELTHPDITSGHVQVRILECIRTLGHIFGGLEAWNTYCTTVDMLGPDCPYTRIAAKTTLADPTLRAHLERLHTDLTTWLMR